METYKGMDGMKTGYVGPSGFNLVASAVRNDRRIIGVVFGGRSAASRNTHMANLLDNGFARVGDSSVLIASADAHSPAPVPPRKPAILVALNTLNKVAPSNGTQAVKLASLGPVLDPVKFGELVGEGDLDPAESRRIETGLVAVSAIRAGVPNRRSAC
jgi:D-alanyl-D-alanine carboxypeptidase